jgi:hypothetical protein
VARGITVSGPVSFNELNPGESGDEGNKSRNSEITTVGAGSRLGSSRKSIHRD